MSALPCGCRRDGAPIDRGHRHCARCRCYLGEYAGLTTEDGEIVCLGCDDAIEAAP